MTHYHLVRPRKLAAVFYALAFLLSERIVSEGVAGELCATVSYDRFGMAPLLINPGEDPVERLLRLRFDRDKHIAKLWGEFCAEMHKDSGPTALGDCVNTSGFVRPIKTWQENEIVSQSSKNGGLEFDLDESGDQLLRHARWICKDEFDRLKRQICEKNFIHSITQFGDIESQSQQEETLQDVEIHHLLRLPFDQNVGTIETRVVLQGAKTNETTLLDGQFSVVKCPDESREDRDLDRRMTKEIKRLTSK